MADSSRWGAVSILQSIKVIPTVLAGVRKAKGALRSGRPGLFLPIDFGFVNIRLAKFAKRRGWKVLYFMPPGSWRKDRQGKDLGPITDAVVTPFPWSVPLLEASGVRAYWWGHPICELLAAQHADEERDDDRVVVLPGSRTHEIRENLPIIAKAFSGLDPRYSVEFALAPTVRRTRFEERWRALAPNRAATFTEGDTYGAFRRARAAIVCSGTATLEAALLRVPMAVIYGVSKSALVEAAVVRFKMPEFISLPNILLGRRLVPEFVGADVDPDQVRREIEGVLPDGASRAAQLSGFDEIESLLGKSHAIGRTAALALELLADPA